MTPRQADVAFVLEGVRGVRAVYAVTPSKSAGQFDFAIELEPGNAAIVEMHYALLRVLTHEETARVYHYAFAPAPGVANARQPLRLSESDRNAARVRVPTPKRKILVADDDPHVAAAIRELYEPAFQVDVCTIWYDADPLARSGGYEFVFCSANWAAGPERFLARLPFQIARLVFAVGDEAEAAHPRWRWHERFLVKPFRLDDLRARLALPVAGAPTFSRRRLSSPAPGASPHVLLVDLDSGIPDAVRHLFGNHAQITQVDSTAAVDAAFASPFHLILCSTNAALTGGFLEKVTAEDPTGAAAILVAVPVEDLAFVRGQLTERGRPNRVFPLPLEEAILRAALPPVVEPPPPAAAPIERVRYRRIAALVVDDDIRTQILFSAGALDVEADVTLATTSLAAFEHVVTRPIDLLVASATLRADSGEPFYRVLWRMKPELKARTVLLTALDDAPKSSRILARPLSRAAIAEAITRALR